MLHRPVGHPISCSASLNAHLSWSISYTCIILSNVVRYTSILLLSISLNKFGWSAGPVAIPASVTAPLEPPLVCYTMVISCSSLSCTLARSHSLCCVCHPICYSCWSSSHISTSIPASPLFRALPSSPPPTDTFTCTI